jgi:hypothetical protein
MNQKTLVPFSWALSASVVLIAFIVWSPALNNLTSYTLFPLFGLVAFSLMWVHYITGALRQYSDLPSSPALKRHFKLTSYVVLFCILAHPGLLEIQAYLDGLGLPLSSLPKLYPEAIKLFAIVLGYTALFGFLFYELYRVYGEKPWWRYVQWANILAMLFILYHALTLGTNLHTPWFQAVWVFYGITFILSAGYSEYRTYQSHHKAF